MPNRKPKHKEAVMLDWLLPDTNRKLDRIMANLDALTAAVDQIGTDVGEAVDELRRLGDIIRAGGTVSQEEIDALTEKLSGASTTLDDAVAEDETPA